MEKRVGKLVRDRIPELIRKSGALPSARFMDEDEYKRELLYKLIEEAEELRRAAYFKNDKEGITKEAADLLEVFETIIKEFGLSTEKIKQEQKRKRAKKGGFLKRIFLESVMYPSFKNYLSSDIKDL